MAAIHKLLDSVQLIVGFNLKFDLAWLRRYGIDLRALDIWDCQLAEFILSDQTMAYPSLADSLVRRTVYRKSNFIEENYWSKGIDTPLIPWNELCEYNGGDLAGTDALYQKQLEIVPETKRALLRLQNQDLLVLLDMEYNGLKFDYRAMAEEAERTADTICALEVELGGFVDNWLHFNFDSGIHLSSLLYGGTVEVDVATPYESVVKSGPNQGKTVTRNRWETISKTFPRLVEPIEGTELKREGTWSVDEPTLKQLKTNKNTKRLITLLLQRAELEKYLSTYLLGIPKHSEKYDWQDDLIHGVFNQCRVVTGRLSSEKPNQQNFPDEVMKFIVSRFPSAQ